MTVDRNALLFAIVMTALFFGGKWLLAWWWTLARRSTGGDAVDAWVAVTQPEIAEPTAEEVDELERRLPDLALPALILAADQSVPIGAGGTRIGGPVWLADGAEWPTGKEGRVLEFVAQLDFAAMPVLPDYPEAGLLQLFVGRDDCHGADFDAQNQSDFLLLWHPQGPVGGRLVPPPHLPRYGDPDDDGYCCSPFIDSGIRASGVALRATPASMMPRPYDRPVEALCAELGIDDRAEALEPLRLGLDQAAAYDRHHVGGHPLFVQHDPRLDLAHPPEKRGQPSPWRDHDRVLFQLTSRNGLQWGDVGEAQVLIRRADLLARDFSRAIFHWDCS